MDGSVYDHEILLEKENADRHQTNEHEVGEREPTWKDIPMDEYGKLMRKNYLPLKCTDLCQIFLPEPSLCPA